MTKRHLTEQEKKLVNSNIVVLKDELEWHQAQNELNKLQLDKLIPLNYKKTLADYKQKVKSTEAIIEEHTNAIKILKDQLRNGVELKDEKDTKAD